MTDESTSYTSAKAQLDDIAEQVKSKDLPLEKALDLYEEAIRIGNTCADLIDVAEFTVDELDENEDGGEAAQEEATGEVAKPREESAAE
ncbi:MAG: exodeoxyribonuclease VII small subunit [Coriobacteriales bacterium]|jgi:exodeoxyribonuclease VII small subunit